MSCAECELIVNKALKNKRGIHGVNTSYLLDTVYVDYDPKEISEEEIKKLVEKLGYKVVCRKA